MPLINDQQKKNSQVKTPVAKPIKTASMEVQPPQEFVNPYAQDSQSPPVVSGTTPSQPGSASQGTGSQSLGTDFSASLSPETSQLGTRGLPPTDQEGTDSGSQESQRDSSENGSLPPELDFSYNSGIDNNPKIDTNLPSLPPIWNEAQDVGVNLGVNITNNNIPSFSVEPTQSSNTYGQALSTLSQSYTRNNREVEQYETAQKAQRTTQSTPNLPDASKPWQESLRQGFVNIVGGSEDAQKKVNEGVFDPLRGVFGRQGAGLFGGLNYITGLIPNIAIGAGAEFTKLTANNLEAVGVSKEQAQSFSRNWFLNFLPETITMPDITLPFVGKISSSTVLTTEENKKTGNAEIRLKPNTVAIKPSSLLNFNFEEAKKKNFLLEALTGAPLGDINDPVGAEKYGRAFTRTQRLSGSNAQSDPQGLALQIASVFLNPGEALSDTVFSGVIKKVFGRTSKAVPTVVPKAPDVTPLQLPPGKKGGSLVLIPKQPEPSVFGLPEYQGEDLNRIRPPRYQEPLENPLPDEFSNEFAEDFTFGQPKPPVKAESTKLYEFSSAEAEDFFYESYSDVRPFATTPTVAPRAYVGEYEVTYKPLPPSVDPSLIPDKNTSPFLLEIEEKFTKNTPTDYALNIGIGNPSFKVDPPGAIVLVPKSEVIAKLAEIEPKLVQDLPTNITWDELKDYLGTKLPDISNIGSTQVVNKTRNPDDFLLPPAREVPIVLSKPQLEDAVARFIRGDTVEPLTQKIDDVLDTTAFNPEEKFNQFVDKNVSLAYYKKLYEQSNDLTSTFKTIDVNATEVISDLKASAKENGETAASLTKKVEDVKKAVQGFKDSIKASVSKVTRDSAINTFPIKNRISMGRIRESYYSQWMTDRLTSGKVPVFSNPKAVADELLGGGAEVKDFGDYTIAYKGDAIPPNFSDAIQLSEDILERAGLKTDVPTNIVINQGFEGGEWVKSTNTLVLGDDVTDIGNLSSMYLHEYAHKLDYLIKSRDSTRGHKIFQDFVNNPIVKKYYPTWYASARRFKPQELWAEGIASALSRIDELWEANPEYAMVVENSIAEVRKLLEDTKPKVKAKPQGVKFNDFRSTPNAPTIQQVSKAEDVAAIAEDLKARVIEADLPDADLKIQAIEQAVEEKVSKGVDIDDIENAAKELATHKVNLEAPMNQLEGVFNDTVDFSRRSLDTVIARTLNEEEVIRGIRENAVIRVPKALRKYVDEDLVRAANEGDLAEYLTKNNRSAESVARELVQTNNKLIKDFSTVNPKVVKEVEGLLIKPKPNLYHGTAVKNWVAPDNLYENGSRGELGHGTYLTTEKSTAVSYSQARMGENVNPKMLDADIEPTVHRFQSDHRAVLSARKPLPKAVANEIVKSLPKSIKTELLDEIKAYAKGYNYVQIKELVEKALVRKGVEPTEQVLRQIDADISKNLRGMGLDAISDTKSGYFLSLDNSRLIPVKIMPQSPVSAIEAAAARYNVDAKTALSYKGLLTTDANLRDSSYKTLSQIRDQVDDKLKEVQDRIIKQGIPEDEVVLKPIKDTTEKPTTFQQIIDELPDSDVCNL
jgi:hypothetical protein